MSKWITGTGSKTRNIIEKPYDGGVKQLEVYDGYGRYCGTIFPADVDDYRNIVEQLNNGESPVGWGDGMGGVIE